MSTPLPHIVILGAGPAGLGAAYRLASEKRARVTVLEQSDSVGGNAGSFELDGLRLDYGSHRLHPSCEQRILDDIKSLLGGDLLLRPRHGRIRLQERWIHFPLKPADLVLKMKPAFSIGVFGDMARKLARGNSKPAHVEDTFSTVLLGQLGPTICEGFYFPYSRKIWGLDPGMISGIQAKRRISGNSVGKILRKVLSTLHKGKESNKNFFYYPRSGFGQISEALYKAAAEAGAEVLFRSRVTDIGLKDGHVDSVTYERDSAPHRINADYVWSTIPITVLVRALRPCAPEEALASASKVRFRSMILVYLVLDQDRFTEYDAHYFPEADIPITRLSEPKNYTDTGSPAGITALCAELPCGPGDDYWRMSGDELGKVVLDSLKTAGIPVTSKVLSVEVRRLASAYPIYDTGYEKHFECMDNYIEEIGNLLTFGRQGLFAHDNTHHALYMAYAAVDCLDDKGSFDLNKWLGYRKIFESHVVED